MQKRSAFTLIELLVVVAIIALLLSVIMPALNAAKRQASGAVCLSNENQLSKAWYLFAGDRDDQLVDGQPDNRAPYDCVTEYNSGVGYNFTAYPVNETYSGNDWTLEGRIRGFERGALWPYFESYKLYHCPADKRNVKDEERYGYRTYGIGGVYSHAALDAWISTSTWEGNVAATKMTEIITPSSKIVWIEEMDIEQRCNDNTWNIFLTGNKSWYDPLAVWHGDSSTFGFADGHAERHKWENKLTIDKGDYAKATEAYENGTNQKIAPVPAGEEEDWDWFVSHYIPKRIPANMKAQMPR